MSNDRLHLDESDQGNTQVKSDDHKLTYLNALHMLYRAVTGTGYAILNANYTGYVVL